MHPLIFNNLLFSLVSFHGYLLTFFGILIAFTNTVLIFNNIDTLCCITLYSDQSIILYHPFVILAVSCGLGVCCKINYFNNVRLIAMLVAIQIVRFIAKLRCLSYLWRKSFYFNGLEIFIMINYFISRYERSW